MAYDGIRLDEGLNDAIIKNAATQRRAVGLSIALSLLDCCLGEIPFLLACGPVFPIFVTNKLLASP